MCVLLPRPGGRAGPAVVNVVSTERDNSDHMGVHEITLERLSRSVLFNLKISPTTFNPAFED